MTGSTRVQRAAVGEKMQGIAASQSSPLDARDQSELWRETGTSDLERAKQVDGKQYNTASYSIPPESPDESEPSCGRRPRAHQRAMKNDRNRESQAETFERKEDRKST